MWKNFFNEVSFAVSALGGIALVHAIPRLIMESEKAPELVHIGLHYVCIVLVFLGAFIVSQEIFHAYLLFTNQSEVANSRWPGEIVLFLALISLLASFLIQDYIERNVELLTQLLVGALYLGFGFGFYAIIKADK